VKRLTVSTDVEIPPSEAYEFLLDFPGYAEYSKHLTGVEQDGDGGPGTEYRLHFAWWKLTYTAHSRVTDVDPPHRIDWEVTKHIDAEGRWEIEPLHDRENPASRVSLVVEYDPESVSESAISLPPLVGLDWVVGKATGLIEKEGERVVERIVADLEGERRPVDLHVSVD